MIESISCRRDVEDQCITKMKPKSNCGRARVRILLPSAIALGLSLSMVFTHATAEELQELLRLTRDHPSVTGELAAANAAAHDIDVAKAAGKVQLGMGLGSAGYSSQTGRKSEAVQPYIAASKLLYDHGRTKAEVEGREAAHQAKQARAQLQRETIGKQLTSLYATALGHHLAGQILDEQVAALQDLLKRVATIVQIDPGRASEANQVESRLASAMSNRETRLVGEREAWQQVTQLLQRDVRLDHELPDLLRLQLLPKTLLQADRMLEEHPALSEARRNRDESEAAFRVATKWNRPRWTIDVRADSPRNPGNGQMEWFEGVAVELRGNLSLLDGGAGSATAQGESQRLAAADAAVERVRRDLKQELQREWVALPLRERQLATMDELVDAADRMRKAGEEQFFAGRRPLIDLMAFDSEYFTARVGREEQRVQYLTSQWMILAALGRLSEMADSSTPMVSASIDGPSSKSKAAKTVLAHAENTTPKRVKPAPEKAGPPSVSPTETAERNDDAYATVAMAASGKAARGHDAAVPGRVPAQASIAQKSVKAPSAAPTPVAGSLEELRNWNASTSKAASGSVGAMSVTPATGLTRPQAASGTVVKVPRAPKTSEPLRSWPQSVQPTASSRPAAQAVPTKARPKTPAPAAVPSAANDMRAWTGN